MGATPKRIEVSRYRALLSQEVMAIRILELLGEPLTLAVCFYSFDLPGCDLDLEDLWQEFHQEHPQSNCPMTVEAPSPSCSPQLAIALPKIAPDTLKSRRR